MTDPPYPVNPPHRNKPRFPETLIRISKKKRKKIDVGSFLPDVMLRGVPMRRMQDRGDNFGFVQ
ncbi:unnamed protein product [Sphenostylis stenocarpa]|uniref:Uncharacterized protein n=1 Tax=Sphenostylis stenocarpa TaxID=92480 RepID=A0AA86SIQ3_9FABA|nr:unnamed protein product [Sphenostylis stenocarpa]